MIFTHHVYLICYWTLPALMIAASQNDFCSKTCEIYEIFTLRDSFLFRVKITEYEQYQKYLNFYSFDVKKDSKKIKVKLEIKLEKKKL